MKTLFQSRTRESDPEVVDVEYNRNGHEQFRTRQLTGKFFRVMPETLRDIMALKMLEHRHDKFAPANGDGVIITQNALNMLDA